MTFAWLDARGSVWAVAILRMALGGVVLLHLRPFLADVAAGERFADRFHDPFAGWYPEPSHTVYGVVLSLGTAAAVLLAVGLFTRVATAAAWAVVTYNLFLSETHFHQNRAYLVVLLGGLALLPSGRVLSVDAVIARRRGRPLLDDAPLWPLWLLRVEVAAVYLASGAGKLLDGDWWGGTVTWDRVVQVRDQVEASPLPSWAVRVLVDRDFHSGAAKVIVLTELAIGLGFWWRATRPGAVWLAICFHLAIELTASVQIFGLEAVAALLVWVTPSTRDRHLTVPTEGRTGRLLDLAVTRLDWLARFTVERSAGGDVRLVERDGRATNGTGAAVRAASRLPLVFWAVAPLLLLPVARPRRGATDLVDTTH